MMVPESTPGLMPALVKLYDAAVRLLGTDAKVAKRWVVQELRKDARFKTFWNKIDDRLHKKAALQAMEAMDKPAQGGLFYSPEAASDALQGDLFAQPAAEAEKPTPEGVALDLDGVVIRRGKGFIKGKFLAEVDARDAQASSAEKKPNALEYLASIKKARQDATVAAKQAPREIVVPAEDKPIGKNEAGNLLYERKDGSVYQMRNGRPDFGGILEPVAEPTPESKPDASPIKTRAIEVAKREYEKEKNRNLKELRATESAYDILLEDTAEKIDAMAARANGESIADIKKRGEEFGSKTGGSFSLEDYTVALFKKESDAKAALKLLDGVYAEAEQIAADIAKAPTNAQEGIAAAQAKAARFAIGKSLTKEQRKQVLDSLVDVYKSKGAEREFKGQDSNGNDRYGYVYSPELFEKSDITGAIVRYYVTLPDGRIAHPTELFPDVSASDVERMALEQESKKKAQEAYENAIKPFYPDFDSANLMATTGQVVISKGDRLAIIPDRTGAVGQARQQGWEVAKQAQTAIENVVPTADELKAEAPARPTTAQKDAEKAAPGESPAKPADGFVESDAAESDYASTAEQVEAAKKSASEIFDQRTGHRPAGSMPSQGDFSSSTNRLPSGNSTYISSTPSPSVKSIPKTQPSGNLSGTFIGTPPASILRADAKNSEPEPAGAVRTATQIAADIAKAQPDGDVTALREQTA